MKNTRSKLIIFIQSRIATIGSLYYGRYGDPVKNLVSRDFFNAANGYNPCEMCWFARVLMYPILILIIIYFWNRDDKIVDPILILSGLGIALEGYQYYFQMTHSSADIESFICNGVSGASCAATDVMYWGFITIPFLCLVAFVVIFIIGLIWKYRSSKDWF